MVVPCPVALQGDHAQASPSDGEEDVLGPRVLAVLAGARRAMTTGTDWWCKYKGNLGDFYLDL